MDRKYDVGIVGCWYWGNYGSLLNGYATFNTIKKLGLKPLNIVTPENGFEPHAKRFFAEIYSEHDLSEKLGFDKVSEYNSICDMFITGSDQIWNYNPRKKDKRYDYYFRLDFVSEYKKKISFATSLGKIIEEKDDDYFNFKRLYDRYDAISLREKQAVDYFEKRYGIKAKKLIEPVFVPDKNLWIELAYHSNIETERNYLFSYILDPNIEKRNLIIEVSSKLQLNAINALDGFSSSYNSNKELLDLPNTLPNVWCADIIKHFINAKYIITDSFHGVCFALIFNKPFIAISNHRRGIDRFESLLNEFDLKNYLVDEKNIHDINWGLLEKKICFETVNHRIDELRNDSVEWLKTNINKSSLLQRECSIPRTSINNVLSVEKCVGCGSCVAKCKKNAIELRPDEKGVYRAYVNTDKCVDCGSCIITCPALSLPENNNTDEPKAYAFINADEKIRNDSSSGGAFSAIAEWVIDNGGVVVGAQWTRDFKVEHVIVDKIEDLKSIRKSKYLQSYIGSIYKEVKTILDQDRYVLFSGTPCQVAGIKKFLDRPYNKLLLIDVLCANCSSAELFDRYRKEKFGMDELDKYDFRYKKPELVVWDCNSSVATLKSGKVEVCERDSDAYLKMYHSCSLGISSQCRMCKYQGVKRVGDITLGDCWGIEKYDKSIDARKGVSLILVNNDKGAYIIYELQRKRKGLLKREPLQEVKKYNWIAFSKIRNWNQSLRSKTFWDQLNESGFELAVDQAFHCKSSAIEYFNICLTDVDLATLTWKAINPEYVSGYDIEQHTESGWELTNKIEDKFSNSLSLNLQNYTKNQAFRIRTYYKDESVMLYGEYKESVWK